MLSKQDKPFAKVANLPKDEQRVLANWMMNQLDEENLWKVAYEKAPDKKPTKQPAKQQ